MEVKCHIQKAKPEDVPKFPSRKEEQTFDCFNITVIYTYISMTQLLSHTFAHLTGSSFRLKAKLLPIKNILGVKYN